MPLLRRPPQVVIDDSKVWRVRADPLLLRAHAGVTLLGGRVPEEFALVPHDAPDVALVSQHRVNLVCGPAAPRWLHVAAAVVRRWHAFRVQRRCDSPERSPATYSRNTRRTI